MEKHGTCDYRGSLNELCDSLAKACRRRQDLSPPNPVHRFVDEGWSLSLHGLKLDCVDSDHLYDATHGDTSRQHWQTRQDIPVEVMDNINWDLLGQAMDKWPMGKRKWLAKHPSGFSATGGVMRRRKEWQHDKCPLCDRSNEDAQHVLSCRDIHARRTWEASLLTFQTHLETIDANPDVMTIVSSRLHSWSDSPHEDFSNHPFLPCTVRALHQQDAVGWKQFVHGRLSQDWLDPQDSWLAHISTRWKRSVALWGSEAIAGILEVPWSVWEGHNEWCHNPSSPVAPPSPQDE